MGTLRVSRSSGANEGAVPAKMTSGLSFTKSAA